MARTIAGLLAASLLLCAGGALAADGTGDKAAQRKALQEAASRYQKHREDCTKMKDFDRKVCYAEARAAYRKDEANAVADFRNTPRARMDAEVEAANADLALERVRCSEKTGELRDSCRKEAKDAQRKAVAEAVRKEKAALASAGHGKGEGAAPAATAHPAP